MLSKQILICCNTDKLAYIDLTSTSLFSVPEASLSDDCEEWRNGPGKLWYDLAQVPQNSTNFDYGFKLSAKV